MPQLKMVWLSGTPVKHYQLPKGYTILNFKQKADKIAWGHICDNGLCDGSDGITAFNGTISCDPNIDPYNDTFFLDYNGVHIGTVTAYVIPHGTYVSGDIHMVSIRSDFRGKGLSKYLTMIALDHLLNIPGLKYIQLTTDDWRKTAILEYLNAGFQPVDDDSAARSRWQVILDDLLVQYDDLQLLNTDFTKGVIIKKQYHRGRIVITSGDIFTEKGKRLAEYLWQLSGSRFPNCLYICANSMDNEYQKLKDFWCKSGCLCDLLCLTDPYINEKLLADRIQHADIIYISDVNIESIVKYLSKSLAEKYLREACEQGKILCGYHHGAICLSAGGSDCTQDSNANWTKGLGLLAFSVSTHYNMEKIPESMVSLEDELIVSMVDGDIHRF